jgi:hypothetical protein
VTWPSLMLMVSPGARDPRAAEAVCGGFGWVAAGWLAAIAAGIAISPTASVAVARVGVVRCEIFIAICLPMQK